MTFSTLVLQPSFLKVLPP